MDPVSSLNIPDGIMVALQGWVLKEIFTLKASVASLSTEQTQLKEKMKSKATTCALLIGLPILAALTGCMGLADTVKAAAGDPAIVAARVNTPWGSGTVTRVGGSTNTVTVTPDGTVTVNK